MARIKTIYRNVLVLYKTRRHLLFEIASNDSAISSFEGALTDSNTGWSNKTFQQPSISHECIHRVEEFEQFNELSVTST